MHIAVIGAGAIGCYLAARLSEAGHRVTLVGRPAQVAAIRQGGLLQRDRAGERRYRVAAVEALDERPDLALLTVKTQDVAAACRDIAPYVPGVPVVAMQNGVQGDGIAADVLGRDAVVGAVVMCAATYLQPGEVSVEFPGWLVVGEPFTASRARTRAIVTLLDRAIPTYLTGHLVGVRWSKLISNLNNALCAATGLPLTDIIARAPNERVRALPARLMREGYAVARAGGVRFDHGLYGLSPRALRRDRNAAPIALLQAAMAPILATLPERAAVEVLSAAGRSRLNRLPVRGSTWQSIARGRPTEMDYLNGEIVRLGQQLGLPTPYNSHLVDLVHAVETSGTFCAPGELAPDSATRGAAAGRAR